MIPGIDYHADRGSPDLVGLDFAIHKATEGISVVDIMHSAEIRRIRDRGMMAGHYHFGWPTEDPIRQAEHFVNVADPRPGELLACDFEPYPDGRNWSRLTTGQRDQWRHAFIAHAQSLVGGPQRKNRVGTYCDVSVWHSLPTDDPGDFLWIAAYGVARPPIAHQWDIWQHQGNPIDADWARFATTAEMHAWASLGTVSSTNSPEDDMPAFTVDHTGGGATFARGRYSNVAFFCDNTLIGGEKDPGAELRVVVWATGQAPDVHHITVTDRGATQEVVRFPHPEITHTVTVTRTDKGEYPVYAEVS